VPKAAEQFKLTDIEEHARGKGMWAGALTRIAIPDLLGAIRTGHGAPKPPLRLVELGRPHTPAVLKIIDEIVVNATDHAKTHEAGAPGARVSRIDITFDRQTGEVAVYNDGPGIPVAVHAEASRKAGRTVYVPEVAFGWFLSGTNIDKPLDCVRGGINGLGAKLANVHSRVFTVETTDGAARLFYLQQFRDRLRDTRPPAVVDLRQPAAPLPAGAARPHTRVSFTPAYAELGYAPGLGTDDAADLEAWLRLRAHQAAAYIGARVAVTFNGEPCATTSAAALGRLLLTLGGEAAGEGALAQPLVLSGAARAAEEPYKRHPWDVAVVVLPVGQKAGRRAAAQSMAIVNGVLSCKGAHVLHLKKALSAAVEDKLRRATKQGRAKGAKGDDAKGAKGDAREAPMGTAETLAGVRLVLCGALPGADWGGQRKDELQVPRRAVEGYLLAPAFLKQVGGAVAERILAARGARHERADLRGSKYTGARHAGKAARAHTFLMAAEGDSALGLLRAGLTQARGPVVPGGPSFDWCGMISLQGVVINAARQTTAFGTSDGDTLSVPSAKLRENKRLSALAEAFGLEYGRPCDTPAALEALPYGQLLLCVDEDLDGKGKIAALVLVWLYRFWPGLLRAGRVGRFLTPVARVYPRREGPPLEFYYEAALAEWLAAHPGWEATYHPPRYYKGLAAHGKDEVRRMFAPEAFRRAVRTYTEEDAADCAALFDVYFGPRAALRKAALVTPVAYLAAAEAAELDRRRLIPVGRVQLEIDTKAYKNEAVRRQIPGVADGLNPARRKVLHGATLRFASEAASKELKVFQLGGAVADRCFYHHGPDSLHGTIVYLAQAYPGARLYPYLIGDGQLGDRHGTEAGSARYVGVRLGPLVKAAFPPADRWHLPYVFEDGERAEPLHYVPVAPMACLETYRIVSEAWNNDGFGRELAATLAVVEAYVAGEPGLLAAAERLRAGDAAALAEAERLAVRWPLPMETRGFDGEVRPYRGVDHSFGAYTWDPAARRVAITELPVGVATAKYLESLAKPGRAELLAAVEDRSTDEKVELHLTLAEGAFEAIVRDFGAADIDPLEDALLLRAPLRPHLNYYSPAGGVLEFGGCYLAALLYWASLRRELYLTRLTRERIVAELRVLEETETLRYIGLEAELDLARISDEARAAEALRGRGFPPIDKGLLHRPEYTPNDQLRELVLRGPGAGYGYLLNLKARELLQSAAEKRRLALEGVRAELARVGAQLAERPVAGASVWRAELEEFKRVVARGIATGWQFK
jgi:DNA gyrase/topoisomerase IV subunit B